MGGGEWAMSQAKAIERRAFLKALAGAGVLTVVGYGAAVAGSSRAPVNVPGSETDPRLIFDSVNPTEVDVFGLGPGTLAIAARRDHLHRLRSPLTGGIFI